MPLTPFGGRNNSQESSASSSSSSSPSPLSLPSPLRPSPSSRNQGTTVTMMLAERMARSDWSVDDEHFFETNTMNVWQTLEFLSGLSLRKRYHYEGYNDTENIVRTLTPSWRRDSFVEKNAAAEDATAKYPPADRASVSGAGASTSAAATAGAAPASRGGSGGGNRATSAAVAARQRAGGTAAQDYEYAAATALSAPPRASRKVSSIGSAARLRSAAAGGAKSGKRKKQRKQQHVDGLEMDPEYALSPANYTDLVKCSFNLPRISAFLERLMGTNVVRLTDRNYMKELRERIDEDYRVQLQKRIKARELKEVERERLLIIEGKSDVIPEELADDPIFVVNKQANIEIQKDRAKLKTNREKNSERLKLQGVKWERERLQHEEQERVRLEFLKQRREEQKELEERYKCEDAQRGMDLLRIENEDWRPCEQKLKEFLERERTRMKERSMRRPAQFTSDPNDIQNIVRARQKFRETEQRIRHELEAKFKDDKTYTTSKDFEAKSAASKVSKIIAVEGVASTGSTDQKPMARIQYSKDFLLSIEEDDRLRKKFSDDASDVTSEEELVEVGSSISESIRRHAEELQHEIEEDVQRGLLISKDQYDHLRYEDAKILQLRNAKDIRELYQLAEEIIIGEIYEEEIVEEEMGEEEEDVQPPGDSAHDSEDD